MKQEHNVNLLTTVKMSRHMQIEFKIDANYAIFFVISYWLSYFSFVQSFSTPTLPATPGPSVLLLNS
jgi:hypothetical protein